MCLPIYIVHSVCKQTSGRCWFSSCKQYGFRLVSVRWRVTCPWCVCHHFLQLLTYNSSVIRSTLPVLITGYIVAWNYNYYNNYLCIMGREWWRIWQIVMKLCNLPLTNFDLFNFQQLFLFLIAWTIYVYLIKISRFLLKYT